MQPEIIVQIACGTFGLTKEKVLKRSGTRGRVSGNKGLNTDIISISMHLIKEHDPKITLKQIGALLGGYDHTTVIFHLKRAKDFIDTKDELFVPRLKKVRDRLLHPTVGDMHVRLSAIFANLKSKKAS